MSSQQFPRPGLSSGLAQGPALGNNTTGLLGLPGSQKNAGKVVKIFFRSHLKLDTVSHDAVGLTGREDSNNAPREAVSSGPTGFRDDKQETVVVRPYPQPQTQLAPHGAPSTLPPPLPQHLPVQPGMPVSVSAAAPHLPQGLSLAFTEGPLKVQAFDTFDDLILRSNILGMCITFMHVADACLKWLTVLHLYYICMCNFKIS